MMNSRKNFRWLSSAAAIFCLISATGQSAHAGTLYNGWNYAFDPGYDSLARNGKGEIVAGNTIYEIYGMAIKEDIDSNSILVAINTNLPMTGRDTGSFIGKYPISNRNIGFGDLLFDFSGMGNFKAANDASRLFGIRFAPNNDSTTPGTGVYSGVKAVSVVAQNAGWPNLWNHNVKGVYPRTGSDARTGDLAWDDPYFSVYNTSQGYYNSPESLIPNVIESGTKIGDIIFANDSELAAAGFNFNFLPATGSQTFGFKFDKSLLPVGNFIASLFPECNNDAVALVGETTPPLQEKVPEPSSILGLAITGLMFGTVGKRWRFKAI